MGNLPGAFNTSDVADDIWPEGEYLCEITKSEMKDTKAGDGKYLQLGFKCLEGKQKGLMVFTNLNLVNPNEVAVNIANQELKRICTAIGKKSITDSSELHGIPLTIRVAVRSEDNPYPGNDIKGYKAAKSGGKVTANPFGKK